MCIAPLLHVVPRFIFDRSMPCLGSDLSHLAATALAALTRPKPHNKAPQVAWGVNPSHLGWFSLLWFRAAKTFVSACKLHDEDKEHWRKDHA